LLFIIHYSENIYEASAADLEIIKNHISDYELDNRELLHTQFLVYKKSNTILGFGRIRNYANFDELCSLGVIEPERNKTIGKKIVNALIQKSLSELYLVCVIPEYFEPIGFKIVNEFPNEIFDKLNYCTNTLVVEGVYVAMKLIK
jgi:N-acetylglutamate synthase-like GNAT family acetyltransferase